MEDLQIRPSGDRALTVTVSDSISESVNDRIMQAAAFLSSNAEKAEGIVEVIPSYSALEVFYQADRLSFRQAAELARKAFSSEGQTVSSYKKVFEIPCCYHGYFAPDLQALSDYTGLSPEEIIKIHAGTDYRIYMMGFLPGFPYLGGLAESLAMPRLKVPRKKIPAGSVGIGGSQTGIYPVASPGGWRLIGRTPVDLYNPAAADPILLHAGDYIRFVPITTDRYYEIRQQILHGTYHVPEKSWNP